MTGRTHDLAAFSLASWALVRYPTYGTTLTTLVVALLALFLGGLWPDVDNKSADFWEKIPGGSLIGLIIAPLLGGHRMISHSLVGLGITGGLLRYLLGLVSNVLLVDVKMVWWAFMWGYFSHLVMDSLTKEGVPLFFPIPLRLGFPPIRWLRIETGGKAEKLLVYPLLMLATGYIYISNYSIILSLIKSLN